MYVCISKCVYKVEVVFVCLMSSNGVISLMCVSQGAFILGSGCLIWTTVVSVHRRLDVLFYIYNTSNPPRGTLPLCGLGNHFLHNPCCDWLIQRWNDEGRCSHRSEPSLSPYLINTDYPVAIWIVWILKQQFNNKTLINKIKVMIAFKRERSLQH